MVLSATVGHTNAKQTLSAIISILSDGVVGSGKNYNGIRGETFDKVARDIIAQHQNVTHVPLDFNPEPQMFSADGFHPWEESYKVFGEMMAHEIAARLTGIESKNP